ncbi:hypothetical protein FQA39_LY09866 [Lamprigera yunnana]|nr:hypothetical protein FQA39_LY09866 [Lamprigera yunnana]
MMTKSIRLLNRFNKINHSLQYFSKFNKEILKPQAPLAPDYLLQNLKTAKTPQNVLEIVGTHYKIMNSKQLLQALRSIFFLQKQGSSNESTNDIIQNPNFEKLCRHLKTQAGLIELNETIEALKIVSFVGVSSNSAIVQVLLQLLRHNINDLSLQQLMFLDFLLRQFKSSPLVDALLIAIPIIFEVHMPIKMDGKNLFHLVEYFQFISKKRVSDNCVTVIANNLLEILNNNSFVEPKIAKSIIWSICDMDENEFFAPLLGKALDILFVNLDQISWQDLETTLTKLSYKYSSRFPFYYDSILVDYCCNYIVDRDLGFEKGIHILKKLIKFNHASKNLINYLSKLCNENVYLLKTISGNSMFVLIISLALTEHRPPHWESLKNSISNSSCFKVFEKRDIIWLKLAAAMCSLDIYKLDVLTKALDQQYLDYVFNQQIQLDYEHFIQIYQAIETFQPGYLYLLPPKSYLDSAVSQIKPFEEYTLQKALERGLGGENYVATGIRTALGCHIDHAVVLRKGGYPIALPEDITNLENIQVPPQSQMILIFALGPSQYTINTKQLRGSTAFTLKTLEHKGYSIVPISLETWTSLPDFERIPYLMQAIKLKMEDAVQMSESM